MIARKYKVRGLIYHKNMIIARKYKVRGLIYHDDIIGMCHNSMMNMITYHKHW